MRCLQRRNSTAHGMTVKRYSGWVFRVAAVLGLSCALAGCGGYVADHWPRWAGGMPDDVPPRPGAPGYDQFITHGLPDQTPANPPADTAGTATGKSGAAKPDQKSTAAAAGPVFQQVPAPPAASPAEPGDNANVVNGGLY